MKETSVLVFLLMVGSARAAIAQAPPADMQIAGAVLAAPDDRRAGATVLGYGVKPGLATLRQGSNDLVCLADNPAAEGFSAACYHKDLEPFMKRGRELTSQGVTDDHMRDETRWKEIAAGTLKMPREPRTLYVLTGKSFDAATGQVVEPYLRWVIYSPFATPESTGLSTKPTMPYAPWLMNPGTAGAHIMISPPRDQR